MSRPILKGSVDQSTVIRIVDSADGTPETGVVFNTAGIDLWYRREGGLKVSITEATLATLDAAHADGGFLHIGDGYYRLDLPDAAFATGADGVLIGGTVTGMVVIGSYHPLVAYNPQDAVRLGLTALPNAAANAAGGLPISAAGALPLDSRLDAAVSTRATPAQVNAEVLDVLNVDTFGLIGKEAPGATVSLAYMLRWLYKKARNRISNDGALVKVYADDEVTIDQQADVTKNATEVVRSEFVAGV